MKTLIHFLTKTSGTFGPLFLRLFLALVIFPHGAQKVLGWFGGYGFTGTMAFFTGTMGLPYAIALLPVLTEFLAPVALFFGFATRIAALALGVNFFVAVLMVQLPNGFFMNWFGTQKGEGIEYSLLIFGMVFALMAQGAGRLSVDQTIADKSV
jgi:putative oxidoreductase